MDIWGIDYHWVNGLPISFFLGVVEAGKALANGVAAFGSRFKQGSLVVISGGFESTAWSWTWRGDLGMGWSMHPIQNRRFLRAARGAINKGHLYKISKNSGQGENYRASPAICPVLILKNPTTSL